MTSKARGVALPLVVTFSIQTAVALAVYCAPVLAPVAAPALGVEPAAIGFFIAVTYIGSMLGTVTSGGVVGRFGPIRVSQIGLCMSFIGLAFAGSGLLPLAVLGAFVLGLGYGPSTPASSVILLKAAPPSMVAFTFSIKQTGVPVGAALAGVLVPALIPVIGWQGTCDAIGAGCLALALLIGPERARFDAERNPNATVSLASTIVPVRLVLGNPRLLGMGACGFVFGGVQITLVTYLVTFLTQSFAMTLVLAGLVLSVSQVASVIGRIGWGIVADRLLTRRRMLGLLGLGMGVACLLTLTATPEWPRWLLFAFAALFGSTAVGWNGVWVAEVARLAPQGKVSEATGGCLFFTFSGAVLTPVVFNGILEASGTYAVPYAVFGVPALLIGARFLLSSGK